LRSVYGSGPLTPVKTSGDYVWFKGGWKCYADGGGAECDNIAHPGYNTVTSRGYTGADAVTAEIR
jgi:hypothetical protein